MCIICNCLPTPFLEASQLNSITSAIIISVPIKPYVDAADGATEFLNKHNLIAEKYFLSDYDGKLDKLIEIFDHRRINACIAIGPEAARFLWDRYPQMSMVKVYAMVLHPEKVIQGQTGCFGVSLNVPIQKQIQIYKKTLPNIKNIGLIFDPINNSEFAEDAINVGRSMGIDIILLKVKTRKDIPIVLERNWKRMDCLWLIPDKTVISESIIKYIIKQSITHQIPVIGYNRFFYDSGAAVSLVYSYEKIGKQAGRMMIKLGNDKFCDSVIPAYDLLLNEEVLNTLSIPFTK